MRLATALLALTACTSVQLPPPLTGTQWRVEALNGETWGGSASFGPDHFVIGFGCNTMRGGYRIEGDRLIPSGPLGTTEMACMPAGDGPDIMTREAQGFAIASQPMRVVWHDERRVELVNESGRIQLAR